MSVGLKITFSDFFMQGAVLLKDGAEIGHVTSGGPSPTLKQNIGMGYVPLSLAKPGTKLEVQVRKKVFEETSS